MPDEKVISLLSPTQAIAEIIHYAGSELAAKQILTDGLHSNKLRLTAKYAWGSDIGDLQEEWTPQPRKGHFYGEDVEVETDVFNKSVQWPEELKYWRWDKGDFVIFLSKDEEGWGRFDRLYIQDAYFFRDEVMALVGRSKRSGGRKSDRERWAIFWINVLWRQSHDPREWTTFDEPSELKQWLLEASDGEDVFSDNNIDFAVKLAWERLVLRAARRRMASGSTSVNEQ